MPASSARSWTSTPTCWTTGGVSIPIGTGASPCPEMGGWAQPSHYPCSRRPWRRGPMIRPPGRARDALGTLGRAEEGLRAFGVALSTSPTRETALTGAAALASRTGRRDEALAYWRRALALNPWRSDYHAELARIEMKAGNWRAAAEAFQESLHLNPSPVEIRKWLVQCYLQLGDRVAA